jgi:hypothetical protein
LSRTSVESASRSQDIPLPRRGRAGPLGKGGIKKYVPWSPGPIRKSSETHRGTHPYFFGTVGLGNRKGTNAMIRSDRFIAGIAIVSIIASLGYIALTLIG